jgi:hemerythrin-like metal-binding protein
MQAFIWNSRFETGIASVDEQHRQLVEIINLLGETLIGNSARPQAIAAVFERLAEYAKYHFADEERLMAESGMEPQRARMHRQQHQQFVDQLTTMWKRRADFSNPAEALHGFLSSWLTFHILEEDQAMARQLARIARGSSPEHALAQEQQNTDNANAVLLQAMHTLYQVLALQNQGLSLSNERLESRVAERTRELLQAEKMAAVGQLAAGVAHEINTPIGFVNSNLGTLGDYVGQLFQVIDAFETCRSSGSSTSARLEQILADTDLSYLRADVAALLQESHDGLGRVKNIVQSLRDFAHAENANMVECDLLAALESTLTVIGNEFKDKADVVRELTPLPRVRCIPGPINQVLMNLLRNAVQSIVRHGTITLRDGHDAQGVWIAIEDTGCGMTDAVRERVFEPFFTTKPVGQGTGLGLSTAWDTVVNKHAGRLTVQSTPGAGSCFTLWLPRDATEMSKP